jgi:hypothetical protein
LALAPKKSIALAHHLSTGVATSAGQAPSVAVTVSVGGQQEAGAREASAMVLGWLATSRVPTAMAAQMDLSATQLEVEMPTTGAS